MNVLGKIIFYLAFIASIQSCKKDEIVNADLTTNPFDADYNGPDFFNVESVETSLVVVNGAFVNKLSIVVFADRSLLAINPPFNIQVILNDSTPYQISSSSLVNDRFTLSEQGAETGSEICWQLNLSNAGSIGSGKRVCGTVE